MPKKKYLVTLDAEEREQLAHLLHRGTHATRQVTRARLLLQAAEGWEDRAIAEALSVGRVPSNARARASSRRAWGRWQTVRVPAPGRSWMCRRKLA